MLTGQAFNTTRISQVSGRKRILSLLLLLAGVCRFFSTAYARPTCPRPVPVPILLVHGIYDDGTALRPLQRALETAGYECFTPTLRPADARLGLADLALKLRVAVNTHFGPKRPFLVVAFSMGGLIARSYLEEYGGAARCRGLLTVSTPHAGSIMAFLIGGQGARDLRPFSPFLRALWRDKSSLAPMPLVSIWNPLDLVIFPSFSSAWRGAENRVVFCSSHPVMIRSRVAIRVGLREVAWLEKARAASERQPCLGSR